MQSGAVKMRIHKAGLASRCSLFVRKVVSTPQGDKYFGAGTAFHYLDKEGCSWLVTNWHVLTGRRPDDPGFLLSQAPQSPYRIEVIYPSKTVGAFLNPVTLDIYHDGLPIWREKLLDKGVDIAAIRVDPPDDAGVVFVQDFSSADSISIEPGIDLAIIGYPFEQSSEMPFPIWKKAMVASEPAYTVLGQLQVLLDTAGMPGMSGSPVYTISPGVAVTETQRDSLAAIRRGDRPAIDALSILQGSPFETKPCLTFAGIYAGSTGKGMAGLDRLSLGRMMLAPMVEMVVQDGEAGTNPFMPQSF